MKQHFRPRPIDINIDMPIVILQDDEPSSPPTRSTKRHEGDVPKSEEPKQEEIPIPGVRVVEDYEALSPADWQRSDAYVIYHEKTPAELEEIVEYEMDSEDEEFVASLNKPPSPRGSEKKSILTEEKFERLVDILEKEAFKKIHKIPGRSFLDYLDDAEPPTKKRKASNFHPGFKKIPDFAELDKNDEDIPCCVCNDGDYDDCNLIVFCDGCNLAVHQTCYGVPKIPDGNWYCRRCEYFGKNNQSVKCILCGHVGGALKPTTTSGQWAHVVCALWIPEAAFVDAKIMEPINITKISKDRHGLECSVCGTSEGVCIQCKMRQCYASFHPYCGSQAGLLMEMLSGKGNSLIFKTYCREHSEEIRGDRDRAKKNEPADIINQVCSAEVKAGLHKLTHVPLPVVEAVCNYWLSKKYKSKNKSRPLISRLLMEEDAILHERRRRRHMQVSVELQKMRQLRCELDRVRIILDVLKKRELWKKERIKNMAEIFEVLVKQTEERGYCDDISDCSFKPRITSPTYSTPPHPPHLAIATVDATESSKKASYVKQGKGKERDINSCIGVAEEDSTGEKAKKNGLKKGLPSYERGSQSTIDGFLIPKKEEKSKNFVQMDIRKSLFTKNNIFPASSSPCSSKSKPLKVKGKPTQTGDKVKGSQNNASCSSATSGMSNGNSNGRINGKSVNKPPKIEEPEPQAGSSSETDSDYKRHSEGSDTDIELEEETDTDSEKSEKSDDGAEHNSKKGQNIKFGKRNSKVVKNAKNSKYKSNRSKEIISHNDKMENKKRRAVQVPLTMYIV